MIYYDIQISEIYKSAAICDSDKRKLSKIPELYFNRKPACRRVGPRLGRQGRKGAEILTKSEVGGMRYER